jgi:hypothetical protein
MKSEKDNRLGEERLNFQGCLMRIVEYNRCTNIVVEFQDKYNARVHTDYSCFTSGRVKNPYYPSVYGVGITGNKYTVSLGDRVCTKEYITWNRMLSRCFDDKYKTMEPAYKDVTCCEEWLMFDNFWEWIHSQPNYDKWLNEEDWALDKDILLKGNKVYSSKFCCLVPRTINSILIKRDRDRGNLPIGVTKHGDRFRARCENPILGKRKHIGVFDTAEEAFNAYKQYKENVIKQVAQIEFDSGNITKECYNALMKYEVEITD